jgi:hypothetical protein
MGRTANVVAGVTLTAFSFSLAAEVREGLKHVQLHTPANLYANAAVLVSARADIQTSTGVQSGDWVVSRLWWKKEVAHSSGW